MPRSEGSGTSSRTQGSRARLMRQPSTGVLGMSDVAMLSSLLNISDSVPRSRLKLSNHLPLFHLDLGNEEGQALCSTIIRANARQLSPEPSPNPPTDVNLHRRFSLLRSFSLDLAQILQGNPAILGPIHREVQLLLSHSPSSDSRYLGGSVTTVTPMGMPVLCQKPGLGMFNTTLFPQHSPGVKGSEMLSDSGITQQAEAEPRQDPRILWAT